jgi:hypothetical protein
MRNKICSNEIDSVAMLAHHGTSSIDSLAMVSSHPVARMLQDLGNTADDVAAVLKAHKIQGVRNTVRILNPIVRYIGALVPDTREMDLIEEGTLRIQFLSGSIQRVALPEAVREFLGAFNASAYPELELPESQR